MRLEELARTLEAEVHRLRAENLRLDKLEAENTYLREREEHFAKVLGVCDGGRYRNDWDTRIERLVAENTRLVEELRVAKEALNRIALGQCDSLAADPMKWPTTIAKQALGWTFKDGKQYPPGTALSQSEAPKEEK